MNKRFLCYCFGMTFMDDLTPEEAKAILNEAREKSGAYGVRDRRVCICGHSAGAHAEFSRDDTRRREAEVGYATCKPSRLTCPCKKFVPVLIAGNVRKFMRKTAGGGKLHALGLGLAEAIASGVEIEWLDAGKVCWKCGVTEGIRPVALEVNGIQVERPSEHNAMLCAGCLSA